MQDYRQGHNPNTGLFRKRQNRNGHKASHMHQNQHNWGYFQTVIHCIFAQHAFLLIMSLIYFGIYVGLFLHHGAALGYLSGVNEAAPNVPKWVVTLVDGLPRWGLVMVVTYVSFAIHVQYVARKNASARISHILNDGKGFNLFFKQYWMGILCAVPFIIGGVYLIVTMLSYAVKASGVIIALMGIVLAGFKPYLSLYFNETAGFLKQLGLQCLYWCLL